MKPKKRILSFFLVFVLVLGLLPSAAFAAEPTIVAAAAMHSTAPNSEWNNTLSAAEAMYDDSTRTHKVTPKQGYTSLDDPNSNVSLSSFENWDLWCYSTDMATAGEDNKTSNVVPYFIDVDDSNRKWVLTGVQYSIEVDNQTSLASGIIGIDTLQTNNYIFDYSDYCTCPDNVIMFLVTFTYLWDVSNESGEDDGPITVTYNFNTAEDPTPTQIPANAEIYGIEYESGNISSDSIAQASNNVVKNSVADDTIKVGDINDHFNQYEELIAMAAGEADEVSYYRLTGWNIGENTYGIGDSYVLESSSIVLNAQWEKIMDTEMAATFVEKNSLSAMELTLTTSSNALIEQKSTSMTKYTSGNIVLDDNGIIDYRATVYMDPTVAAFLGGKVVSNPEFAKFDITVNLDSSLKLIADDYGNVTFTFTCPFMKPEAVEVDGVFVEGTTISQNGSPYTITVPASALSSEGGTVLPFVISVQWVGKIGADNKYTVYRADELAAPMTLETQTSVAKMTDYTKQIATTGSVSGVIDFVAGMQSKDGPWYSNGIQEYDIRTLALGTINSEQTWNTLYKQYAENGNELVVLLAAVETLKANNLTGEISGNTVHASYPNDSIITATAGAGGSITPSGNVTVGYGADQTFTITADSGYRISDVLVDGQSVGAVNTYTFYNVTGNHTISATFQRTGGSGGDSHSDPTGNLTISLGGNGGNEDFIFTVIFTDEDGDELENNFYYNGDYTGTIGSGGEITLTGGDKIVIRNLPEGTRYEVIIETADGYTATSTGAEGVIRTSGNEAAFSVTPTVVLADPSVTGVTRWLNTTDHTAYLSGYPGGTFGPDNSMTRAEVAQMFYALLNNKNVTITKTFPDVPANAWYATAVNTLASLGMVSGDANGNYRPNDPITRAEFCVIALAFAYEPDNAVCYFGDVSRSDWFYTYVAQAASYGWIGGYTNGNFGPNDQITRAQVTTIVNNMLGRAADRDYVIDHQNTLVQFNDLTRAHWAYFQIMEATNAHDYTKANGEENWR